MAKEHPALGLLKAWKLVLGPRIGRGYASHGGASRSPGAAEAGSPGTSAGTRTSIDAATKSDTIAADNDNASAGPRGQVEASKVPEPEETEQHISVMDKCEVKTYGA